MMKQLIAERRVILSAVGLLFLSAFAMVALQLQGFPDTTCFMDAFPAVSYHMTMAIYPIAMFTCIALTKDEFSSDRVLRRKTQSGLWMYLVLKVGVICALLGVGAFLATCFMGLIIGNTFFNWDQPDSFCTTISGELFESLNCGAVMLTFLFCVLLGMYVVSMICLTAYWLFRSYVVGALLGLAVCIGGQGPVISYNANRGVFYSNLTSGIDTRYQFWYPLLVVIILAAIGMMKRKREFIAKTGV